MTQPKPSAADLPPFPGHPEPHTYRWTEAEEHWLVFMKPEPTP